jgi:hypothetical protein
MYYVRRNLESCANASKWSAYVSQRTIDTAGGASGFHWTSENAGSSIVTVHCRWCAVISLCVGVREWMCHRWALVCHFRVLFVCCSSFFLISLRDLCRRLLARSTFATKFVYFENRYHESSSTFCESSYQYIDTLIFSTTVWYNTLRCDAIPIVRRKGLRTQLQYQFGNWNTYVPVLCVCQPYCIYHTWLWHEVEFDPASSQLSLEYSLCPQQLLTFGDSFGRTLHTQPNAARTKPTQDHDQLPETS